MRILFICDFFPPFIKGGAEISSYWQAKELSQKNIKVIILAPKYKDKIKIEKDSFKKYWYSLPIKTTLTSPIIFLNPIYIIYLLLNILKVAKKEKIDLIHCQGKFSMPAAWLAKKILQKPLILTIRDYQGLCNYAFCLYHSQKACNLLSFFKKDFLFYYQNYIKNKNIFSFFYQLIISYLGRLNVYFLAFFMKKADKVISVSNYLGQVYINNDYDSKKILTIYNLPPSLKINQIQLNRKLQQKINQYKFVVLYVGKLSLGKGAALLIDAAQEITSKNKNILFIFAGSIHYPIKKIVFEQLVFLGRIEYSLVLKIMKQVNLVCIPSIWPEPLSRGVIEAFYLGKPVICSTAGGPKELVFSNYNGWLFKPTKKDLKIAFMKALSNKNKLKILGENGRKFILKLKEEQMIKLISLYKSLK